VLVRAWEGWSGHGEEGVKEEVLGQEKVKKGIGAAGRCLSAAKLPEKTPPLQRAVWENWAVA